MVSTEALEVWDFVFNRSFKKVKINAILILSNAIKNGTLLQKAFLVEKGVSDWFISLLGSTDEKMLKAVLEGILNFVKGGDLLANNNDGYSFKEYLKEKGAVDKISELMGDIDDEVSQRAREIITMF